MDRRDAEKIDGDVPELDEAFFSRAKGRQGHLANVRETTGIGARNIYPLTPAKAGVSGELRARRTAPHPRSFARENLSFG
jgi:hypothetical protein